MLPARPLDDRWSEARCPAKLTLYRPSLTPYHGPESILLARKGFGVCERKPLLTAAAFLLLCNLPAAAEGIVLCAQAQSEQPVQAEQDQETAQVTLLVRGMMKSRSGAT